MQSDENPSALGRGFHDYAKGNVGTKTGSAVVRQDLSRHRGVADLAALPLWFGNPFTLRDDTNFAEALTPLLIAVIAGLASSEVCLRRFDLPGRSFIHRYWIVVVSVCLGGALMGAPLAVHFTIDGTLAADPPPGSLSGPIPLLVAVVETLPYGLIGAAFGVVIGLMEGLVLALPLAAALGMLHDD